MQPQDYVNQWISTVQGIQGSPDQLVQTLLVGALILGAILRLTSAAISRRR